MVCFFERVQSSCPRRWWQECLGIEIALLLSTHNWMGLLRKFAAKMLAGMRPKCSHSRIIVAPRREERKFSITFGSKELEGDVPRGSGHLKGLMFMR